MHIPALDVPKQRIMEFCIRWKIQELALFGSVLREDFDSNSDVDIMVTFADDAMWSLFDHMRMERELETLFDRRVDIVSKRAVKQSHNWIRRQEILENTQVIFSGREVEYAAG